MDDSNISGTKDLVGKIFVFTGFRDKELKDKVIARGGQVSDSVTSRTSAVVRLDGQEERTGKIADADKKKIPVLYKSDFIKEFNL